MNRFLRATLPWLTGIWLLFVLPPVLYGQTLAYGTSPQSFRQKKRLSVKLRDVLLDMQNKHHVNIVFNEKMVEDRVIESNKVKSSGTVPEMLESILKGSGLQATQTRKDTYLIVSEKEQTEDHSGHQNTTVPRIEQVSKPDESGASLPNPAVVQPLGIQVTGRVADQNGEGLPGVSIVLKGTVRGTTSNNEGSFVFDIPDARSVLVFSFVGYKTNEVTVGNATNLAVVLSPEDKSLGEVVVLGFGQSQKKIAQTGAVASINNKELKQSPTANVMNALAGRLPGLMTVQTSGQPGNDAPQMFIRGRASFNNTDPLVTIDGVQRDFKAISLLDPNEIENVTILKDASATALYGTKGANGVIIVTTRRGESGKPIVNASVEHAIRKVIRIPTFLDSYTYATLANEAYLNDNPAGQPIYSNEALQAYKTGSDPLKYPNVDWTKELLNVGLQTKANFNVSGGAKQVRYFVNVGYLDQGGIFRAEKTSEYDPNANYKRYNFRSNVDIDFDEDFSIGLKLSGAIENQRDNPVGVPGIFWTALTLPPNAFPIKYPTGFYGSNGIVGNPFSILNDNGYVESFNSALSGMLSVSRKLDFITKGLSVKGNYSFDGYYNNSMTRWRSVRQARYTGTGDYNDPSSYTYTGVDTPLAAPASSFSQNRDVWMDMSLNYQRTFGNHEFTGLLLANRTQKVIANAVPFVSQGLVGRIVYNYKYKYFAELNAGYNGTDNFAPKRRYGFFPAVSASWILSEENFLKSVSFLDLLKVRASYGLTGNDQLTGRRWLFFSEYAGKSGYPFGESFQNIPGTAEGAMANPFISWEKAKKTNIGVEIKLFKNLLGVNLDVFREKRYDILITRNSVPAILGVTSANMAPANMGKVNNKGFEIELNHRNRIGKLSYYMNVNGSFARNKIVFNDEANRAYPWLVRTGGPLGYQWGLKALGFFKDQEEINNSPTQYGKLIPGDIKYADLNGDKKIDGNDQTQIGRSTIPEVFYGLSGGMNWKNFDMSFLFQGAAKSDRRMRYTGYWEFFEGGKVNEHHLGRWTPATAATATYPVLHYGANNNTQQSSTFFLENTSYIRLKNLEFGYTLKNIKLSKGAKLSSVRIYATGMNLYTWSKVKQFDPENTGASNIYPPVKIFNFGLSVSF